MEVPRQVDVRRATAAEIRPFVVRAASFVPAGVVLDVEAIIRDGESFIALENGVPFLGYTLQAAGRELVMMTAAGSSSFDLVKALAVMTETHAQGFDSIRFHTIRPGLVRRARKFGYEVAEVVDGVFIMRKQNG